VRWLGLGAGTSPHTGARPIAATPSDTDALPNGPLDDRAVHVCVDMQNLFARETAWHTPWMGRVLPRVLHLADAVPERTLFTHFVPAQAPARGGAAGSATGSAGPR
jgi:hypothetical protein